LLTPNRLAVLHDLNERETSLPPLEINVPVIMSCALLWWVSRGMSWSTRLGVAAVTLALIVIIVALERAGFSLK
jgi:hypothetical protein